MKPNKRKTIYTVVTRSIRLKDTPFLQLIPFKQTHHMDCVASPSFRFNRPLQRTSACSSLLKRLQQLQYIGISLGGQQSCEQLPYTAAAANAQARSAGVQGYRSTCKLVGPGPGLNLCLSGPGPVPKFTCLLPSLSSSTRHPVRVASFGSDDSSIRKIRRKLPQQPPP